MKNIFRFLDMERKIMNFSILMMIRIHISVLFELMIKFGYENIFYILIYENF